MEFTKNYEELASQRTSSHPSVNPSSRDSSFSLLPAQANVNYAGHYAQALYPLYEHMVEVCIKSNHQELREENRRLKRELEDRDKEITALRLELNQQTFLQNQQDEGEIQQPRVHDFGNLTEEPIQEEFMEFLFPKEHNFVDLPSRLVCTVCKKHPPTHVYECGHKKVCEACASFLFGCPTCVKECKDNIISDTQVADN